jgi:GTPase involved in cell partitioning and DNA repair
VLKHEEQVVVCKGTKGGYGNASPYFKNIESMNPKSPKEKLIGKENHQIIIQN